MKMKKIISVLLVLATVLLLFSVAAYADAPVATKGHVAD